MSTQTVRVWYTLHDSSRFKPHRQPDLQAVPLEGDAAQEGCRATVRVDPTTANWSILGS